MRLILLESELADLVPLGNSLYIEEFEKKISEDNRLRRYYSVTDAGKDYLVSLKDDFVELNKGIQNILKG